MARDNDGWRFRIRTDSILPPTDILTRYSPLLRRLAPNALVIVGRGSTGVLPVAAAAVASQAFGLEAMGRLSTALMLAYATAEVADGFSQRYVPRLTSGGVIPSSVAHTLAAFNGLRFVMLAIGLVLSGIVLYPAVQERSLWPAVIVLSALWTTAANMHYALALTTDDYLTMGVGPVIALGMLLLIAGGLAAARPQWGIWTIAIALHLARLAELAFLRGRQAWPGLTLTRAALAEQWRATRYLVGQTLLSALHVRLVIPLAALLAGPAAAASFSIAFSLLAVVSLSAVAITVPAYRRAVAAGPPPHLAEAFRRTRSDFVAGSLACGGMVLALWLATPWLVRLMFGVADASVHTLVRVVLLGGFFEAWALFATVWYYACFRDRDLLIRSMTAVAGGWVALFVGHAIAGAWGMAWGFAIIRLAAVVLVYQPVFASLAHDRDTRRG
jgi:hypothetical protein